MNQYVLSYWKDIKLIDESDDPYIKRNACNLIGFYTKFCHLIYQQFLDTGEWQCGETGMLGLFGISDKTLTRYIKALEQLGLIEVTRAKYDPKENKRNYANIYRVTGMSDPYRTGRQENNPQAAEEPRGKKLKVEPDKDSHPNPNPPKTNNKAIETAPQPIINDTPAKREEKEMGNCIGTIEDIRKKEKAEKENNFNDSLSPFILDDEDEDFAYAYKDDYQDELTEDERLAMEIHNTMIMEMEMENEESPSPSTEEEKAIYASNEPESRIKEENEPAITKEEEIYDTGVYGNEKASEAVEMLVKNGMKPGEWKRALASKDKKIITRCWRSSISKIPFELQETLYEWVMDYLKTA